MRIITLIINKIVDLVEGARAAVDHVREHFDIPADVIAAKLDEAAASAGQPLKWRTSIVDLLKVLGLDSSLEARQELAEDLGHRGAFSGTAEENTKLHAAVLKEIAARGIRLPKPE